jgi:uncharacterized protein YbbC (DUF1343 family)
MTRHTARKVSGGGWARQSAVACLTLVLAAAAACDSDAGTDDRSTAPTDPAAARVALGVDILFRDSLHLLAGRRVGLITNHTGVSWPDTSPPATDQAAAADTMLERTSPPAALEARGPKRENAVSTIDRLHRHPDIDLVALYSPEHGIRGVVGAGEAVEGGVDARTGLPIHSLYGDTRKPTPEMLAGVDVLAFDIQDLGARYYTYVWTMALAMEAAGQAGLDFVVLDRPNPIGGVHVQGNTLDPEFATFVGLYPVPMRHGLTAGELARMLVGEYGLEVDLTVVPLEGWDRRDWWVQTGLPFVPPSPNMPSVASATHYPGTCLFEGTNLSVGRGTDRPFQWIGAPWLDAGAVAERLNHMVRDEPGPEDDAGSTDGVRHPAGFYAEATRFTPRDPGDGKFADREVRAVRFQMTDPRAYDPTLASVAALSIIRELHPDALAWNVAHFDRLAGTDALRQGIVAGTPFEQLTAEWEAQQAEFRRRRAPYLLY